MTQCKHHPRTPSGFASNYRHQCRRKAVKDGLCTIHQPTYVSPAQLKAMAAHDLALAKVSLAERGVAAAADALIEAKWERREALKALRLIDPEAFQP